MCDQVICEIPEECTTNASHGITLTPEFCGDYNTIQSNACQAAPMEFTSSAPEVNCRYDCGDYSSCCYQQPARAQPIRPDGSLMRSNEPMESDTIYKRSYMLNCGTGYRPKPIRPSSNITAVNQPMEKCTVQKLSYLPYCGVARATPIRPRENGLNFRGPLHDLTSQKHDFVAKGFCKRQPIKPTQGIGKSCGPMERCTVNKLSYMPVDVCQNPPPRPILQSQNYIQPSGPSEKCTVQKLSYLPVCLPTKEHMPWAEQKRCVPPKYDNLCSTYNLSYMPNCNSSRITPILPTNALKFLGTDGNDGNTIYKLSYIGTDGRCCRPAPILPVGGLEKPMGPMEKCTTQKLSYQPNCTAERTLAIRPKENNIKATGPMYSMTTQKHDFVSKPSCRTAPIMPQASISLPTTAIEKCTINKLSYMPVNVCEHRRPAAVLPRSGVTRAEGPMEKCTTYKLSYLPNCMPTKEPTPWARVKNYIMPTGPMEKCTIQKMSYGPPGKCSSCRGCNKLNTNEVDYPKAGICN